MRVMKDEEIKNNILLLNYLKTILIAGDTIKQKVKSFCLNVQNILDATKKNLQFIFFFNFKR